MDNQHKLIKGYRDLSPDEITRINALKDVEKIVGALLAEVDVAAATDKDPAAGRWASIARTHLETGFMYAIKSVARPDNGLGQKEHA